MEVKGVFVINKEAYSCNVTPPLCMNALPCLHTHTEEKKEKKNRSVAADRWMFTQRAQSHSGGGSSGGKWQQPHWRLGVCGPTQVISAPHACNSQRDVHSQGAWRRQEIYTESSGPKEGCADPAQTPAVPVRWVERPASRAKLTGISAQRQERFSRLSVTVLENSRR